MDFSHPTRLRKWKTCTCRGAGGHADYSVEIQLCYLGRIFRTLRVQGLDLTPSGHWPAPELVLTPELEDGPVLITVEYRVPAARARAFVEAMEAMRSFRHREGAVHWDLFRDLADPDRYVETFVVVSWAEHLPQHAPVTVEDQAIEAGLRLPAGGGRAGRRAPHHRPCVQWPDTSRAVAHGALIIM